VLRIFIVLKNPSRWPGFEPLSAVTSTLTTTPPRQLNIGTYYCIIVEYLGNGNLIRKSFIAECDARMEV
jgi:hypothetical protein